jgi:hypothetical protein
VSPQPSRTRSPVAQTTRVKVTTGTSESHPRKHGMGPCGLGVLGNSHGTAGQSASLFRNWATRPTIPTVTFWDSEGPLYWLQLALVMAVTHPPPHPPVPTRQ